MEQFGRYRLEELVGRGGMGEVYRAVDTVHDRVVALKRLPAHLASDEEFRARFRKEAAIASRLTEPHIVPIHDFGEIDGRLYLDMRLVTGRDLAAVLAADGPLAPARAVSRRTPPGCCTATSNRPTCCSPARPGPSSPTSPTSASPARSAGRATPR